MVYRLPMTMAQITKSVITITVRFVQHGTIHTHCTQSHSELITHPESMHAKGLVQNS